MQALQQPLAVLLLHQSNAGSHLRATRQVRRRCQFPRCLAAPPRARGVRLASFNRLRIKSQILVTSNSEPLSSGTPADLTHASPTDSAFARLATKLCRPRAPARRIRRILDLTMRHVWLGLVGSTISEMEVTESTHRRSQPGPSQTHDPYSNHPSAAQRKSCQKPRIRAIRPKNRPKHGNSKPQLPIFSSTGSVARVHRARLHDA